MPGSSRVAVLGAIPILTQRHSVARSLGLQFQAVAARGPSDYEIAFAAVKGRNEALLVVPSPSFQLRAAAGHLRGQDPQGG